MPDAPKTAATVRRDYRGTKGVIDDADPAPSTSASTPTVTTRTSGVTSANVARTERKPEADEGVKAFGAPLSTPEPADRQRRAQSTDDSQ